MSENTIEDRLAKLESWNADMVAMKERITDLETQNAEMKAKVYEGEKVASMPIYEMGDRVPKDHPALQQPGKLLVTVTAPEGKVRIGDDVVPLSQVKPEVSPISPEATEALRAPER